MNQNKNETAITAPGEFLNRNKSILAGYQMRKYNFEKFLRSANLAIVEDANLARALNSQEGRSSLMSALRRAATVGLSLNPQDGQAGLIAYKNKIAYQIFAPGHIHDAISSGKVVDVRTRVIYANDTLEITETDSGDSYTLRRSLDDPGAIRGFLAVATVPDGTKRIQWMTLDQAKEWGDRFGTRKKDGGLIPLWTRSIEGAGQKTVVKQLLTKLHIAAPDLDVAEDGELRPVEVIDIPAEPSHRGHSADDVRAELEGKQAENQDADPPPEDEGGAKPGDIC